MAQPVDRHSRKSALVPPTHGDVARLAQQARALPLEPMAMSAPKVPPRNLSRRFSRQEIVEIVARYKTGDSTTALCRDFGLSKAGVLQLLRNEGVAMRRQVIATTDAKQAVQLYERGLSITELVERIGYSYSTVRKSLHASGVAMRPKGIKRSALEKG